MSRGNALRCVSRPVQVLAVQWTGENVQDVLDLGQTDVAVTPGQPPTIVVHTNNGDADLHLRHWLIKGEYDCYPCDPDTFERRWQPVG